jgi:hypothetical protein
LIVLESNNCYYIKMHRADPDSIQAAPEPLYRMAGAAVQVFDMSLVPWQRTANPGLRLKSVRHDNQLGLFLGQIQFEPMTRSGIHQHQGLATSFVIQGGLTDYHGSVKLHDAGLNFRGATHDAIAYEQTVLVSRLEAPVSYPPNSAVSGIHAGSRYANFANPNPDVPPEVNVPVDSLPRVPTGYSGIERQMIYDYAAQSYCSRFLQLTIKPHTRWQFRTSAPVEFWVRGGNISLNGVEIHANSFVVCQGQVEIDIDCAFGALLLVWAEGPEASFTRLSDKNLFGFSQ